MEADCGGQEKHDEEEEAVVALDVSPFTNLVASLCGGDTHQASETQGEGPTLNRSVLDFFSLSFVVINRRSVAAIPCSSVN
jgi:hypothetical protein